MINQISELLNNVVTELYLFNQTNDYYYSLTEFAVGFARTNVRNLDLCYGSAIIDNSLNAPPYSVTFGPTFIRLNAAQTPTVFNSQSNLSINFLNNLPQNIFIDDAVIVGSVYLTVQFDINNNPIYDIEAVAYKNNSTIIALNGDINDIINNIVTDNYLTDAPVSSVNYLELYRFYIQVSDIYVTSSGENSYIPTTYTTWSFVINFIDYRKPRGFPGFAQKDLAYSLLNKTINLEESNLSIYSDYKASVKSIVSDWLNYTTWVPDLITYWSQPTNQIPINLQKFILAELGINIPLPNNIIRYWGTHPNTAGPNPSNPYMLNIKNCGATYVRISTHYGWQDIELSLGVYSFSGPDAIINTFLGYGFKIVYILAYNNTLYTSGFENGVSGLTNVTAWVNWAIAMVQRYQGQNIIWELWNEPNLDQFWQPTNNASDYFTLISAFGTQAAISAPNEYYLLGGLAAVPNNFTFLTSVCSGGILNYVDGVSLHPYRNWSTPETAIADFNQVQSIINTYAPGGKQIDIYCSEWGYTYNMLHSEGTPSAYEATTNSVGAVNQVLYSESVTTAPWGRIGSFTVVSGILDPFGTTKAFQVPANAGSIGYVQTGAGVVDDYYTVSVYLRCLSGNMGVFFGVDFGGSAADYVYIDTSWRRYSVTVKYSSGGTRIFAIGAGSGQNAAYQFAFPQTEHNPELNDTNIVPLLENRQADFYVRMIEACNLAGVKLCMIYYWQDASTTPDDEFGVLDYSGSFKPAYYSLQNYTFGT